MSCPCADTTLATHWTLILFICIKLALCCSIGCSEQVTSQRTSWFLISSSWYPLCYVLMFLPPSVLLINVNRLNVAWETCGICLNSVRERPDYLCPIFIFSWLPALQLGFTSWLLSWNCVIWVELRWVDEFIYIYITVFSKAFDVWIFTLAQDHISSYIFRLVISLPTHCTVPSCFFFHTLFLLLAMVSKVWKTGGKVLLKTNAHLLCLD